MPFEKPDVSPETPARRPMSRVNRYCGSSVTNRPVASTFADFVGVNDVRGRSLDGSLMRAFGAGFARYVHAHSQTDGTPTVVVGRDTRPSSPELSKAMIEGIAARGSDVVDLGVVSTDTIYFASGYWHVPAAMITASHNPVDDNGIKFCAPGAVPLGRDSGLRQIAQLAAEQTDDARDVPGHIRDCDDVTDAFARYLRTCVPAPDIRPRVVIDAGFGAASVAAGAVFDVADVVGRGLTADGARLEPDPAEPARHADTAKAVLDARADLGVIFDGDADRCLFIDETGTSVSPSAIGALLAARMLRREQAADIVFNAICSRALPDVIAEAGGAGHRTSVGHAIIKQQMRSIDAVFGAEHSGHYYFRDFWYADSGILTLLHVLDELAGSPGGLSGLVAPFHRYHASGEINRPVESPDTVLAELAATFDDYDHDRLDGLTVTAADWWFNVRASNSEPLIRLNAEARDEPTMRGIRDRVLRVLDAEPQRGLKQRGLKQRGLKQRGRD